MPKEPAVMYTWHRPQSDAHHVEQAFKSSQ